MSERLESEDVNTNWARALALILAVSVVLIAGVVYFFYSNEIGQWRALNRQVVEREFKLPRVDAYAANLTAPYEESPAYRWNDDKKSTAEIPIDRALFLSAKNKLIKLDLDSHERATESPEKKP